MTTARIDVIDSILAGIKGDRLRQWEIGTYWERKQDIASDNLAPHFDLDAQIDIGGYCIDAPV